MTRPGSRPTSLHRLRAAAERAALRRRKDHDGARIRTGDGVGPLRETDLSAETTERLVAAAERLISAAQRGQKG